MEVVGDTHAVSFSHARAQAPLMAAPRTVIVGLGASGLATARYLAARGDEIVVLDSREAPPALDALRAALPDARVHLGTLATRWLEGAGRLVVSPGLALDLPIVIEARARGLDIVGELELFARVAPAPVIAVTGSNGKSTVVTLTAALLAAAGRRVLAGGNLGPPALDLLAAPVPDVYVLEVSSFQLETTESLHPCVGAVLNVTADHMDRHGSFEAYAAIKSRLLAAADTAVYNADDPIVSRMARGHRNAVPFAVLSALDRGWSVIENPPGRIGRWLCLDREPIVSSDALVHGGAVGEANALAALALAVAFGMDPKAGIEALCTFAGLPHRMRTIAVRDGVEYVDDSKGTNVGATCAALASIAKPVVLIAGGLGKGADFAPLAAAAAGRVKAAVLIGESADALAAVFDASIDTRRAATLEDAVALAADIAVAGDTVLLSPACASQDMFRDYRERGQRFAAAVRELPE